LQSEVALVQELRAEVDELKSRQGNIRQLKEQIQYLQGKYNSVRDEKDRSDKECSQKLFEGM
jgi:septal ring factor EnvC (AmiA/AmiB activator)